MLEDLVVWYLFLGGAGAGLLFTVAALEALSPHAFEESGTKRDRRCAPKEIYSRFFGPAYGAGVAAIFLGMFGLLLDLGRSERALTLFFQPTFSFVTVGAFSLVILVLLAAVPLIVWVLRIPLPSKTLMLVVLGCCMVMALVVMVYTGFFLASISAVEFWNSPLLPVLFVVSSLSSGMALLVCVVVLTGSGEEFGSTLRRIQKVDAVVIVFEIVVLALFIVWGLFGGETAHHSSERVIQGDLASIFWGCVVFLGLAVPLACEVLNRNLNAYAIIASGVLVLVGGFFLRWCISEAGVAPDIVASVARTLGLQ